MSNEIKQALETISDNFKKLESKAETINEISEKWIKYWSLVFVACAIAVYYAAQQKAVLVQLVDPEGFTNNTCYFVLSVLPALMFWRNRDIVKYALMALMLAIVIMCMKRGAILIGALMLLSFFRNVMLNGTAKTKFINILLVGALLVIGFYIIGEMLSTNEYFKQRLDATMEGNSSGRDVIYERLWQYMMSEANSIHFLIGLGADGTVKAIGQVAHNDWIEYFVDMGVLGIVVFLSMWISLLKKYIHYSGDSLYKLAFAMILILLFFRTLFSMSLSDISLYVSCTMGFCLYNQQKRKNIV